VPVFCARVEFADCAIFEHFFVGRWVGDCYRTDVAIKMMSIQRWAPGVDRGREIAERADGESSWGFLLARMSAWGGSCFKDDVTRTGRERHVGTFAKDERANSDW